MSYTDKNLTCRDCGCTFVFTAGEQEFHDQKGFTNTPGRCPDCRAAAKAQRGGGGFRGGNGPREMFSATCAACGKECQVPFQPNGEKPVYCSDCFQGMRGGNSRSGGRSSYGGGRSRW
ncbi:MAG TPA: zinc-ribbon domain containing protein [Armatimonadota bacterium]|nr:zinc-ribbon domain containing protein [Armatimonadota bacterium]